MRSGVPAVMTEIIRFGRRIRRGPRCAGFLPPAAPVVALSRFCLMPDEQCGFAHALQPPAIAPMTRNGSVPLLTSSGNTVSGGSSDKSSLHAKNRMNGRRFNVP